MRAIWMTWLLCALLGASGEMRAQYSPATPETEPTIPEPPHCIPKPHEEDHWVVAKGMPYSGKRVMTCEVVEPDGTVIKGKRTQLEWRDSEGRTRVEQPDVLDPETFRVTIVDPVEHIDWSFSTGKHIDKAAFMSRYSPRLDSLEYPTTYRGSTNRRIMAMPVIPEGPGYRDEELTSTYVNGLWCEGNRYSFWARPGEWNNKSDHNQLVVTETWFSVDIFAEVVWKVNDPGLGKERNELINVDRSEPDEKLFGPPSDYRVLDVSPKKPLP